MNKPTPGPWRSFSGVVTTGVCRDSAGDVGVIATLSKHREEHKANARLIAAAPTLLGVLLELDKCPACICSDCGVRIKAAISLAWGRS